ncbi:MAG TPA: TIGR03618 family F420-dependent PPOX class oxidoreductase [Streptosporangiaceae bacterium]|nr:TIGR03618 family F420-dependent PPOX class oxidoreductase [Streptosporangiaceae bacterium]
MLEPDVRRLLGTTAVAHLATVLPDGSPHSVPVFVGAEGDQIAIFTGPASVKARNLHRDPRVALSFAPPDDPFTRSSSAAGVAEWLEGDAAWEIVDRIAKRYIGQPYPREQERVVALIEPAVQRVGIG